MQTETINRYLDNALKRDRSLQFIYRLHDRINTNVDHVWEDYGLEDKDMRTTFVNYVLSFMLDFNIDNNYCLLEDINEYIFRLLDLLSIPVSSEEDCQKLTNYILTTVLKNSGESISIPQYDSKEKRLKQTNINFIQSNPIKEEDYYWKSSKDDSKSATFSEHTRRKSYSFSEEGYDMLFSMYEYREKVMASMDIHKLILDIQLKRRDYVGAGKNLRSIHFAITEQEKKIQNYINETRRDPSVYQKKYINEVDTITKHIDDFLSKNEQIQEGIRNDIDEFENVINDNDEKNKELLNVYRESSSVWNELNTLHTMLEKLKAVAMKASLSQMENHNISHFNLRDAIYQSILEDSSRLNRIITVFNPLFFCEPNRKILNPDILLYPPKNRNRQTESITQRVEDVNIEQEKEKQKIIYREKYNALKKVLDTIFSFAIKAYQKGTREISIKDLCQYTVRSPKFKSQLLSDEEAFINVIFQLSHIREKVDIRQLKSERNKLNLESSDISIIQIVQELFCTDHLKDPGWKSINQLLIRYGNPDDIYTFVSSEHDIEVTNFYLILNN